MASAKDVTVVIPCSGLHDDLLERAIRSARESGARVVIADDGCGEVYTEEKAPFIRFFPTHNTFPAGVCVARNVAIHHANTSLILPLDADDYLLPGAVERMAAAWSPSKVVYGDWIGTDHPYNSPPPEMLWRKHVCHATYLFAKEDWQRVGGYDPDFNIGAEDWAFMIALVNAGCELVRLDGDPLYVKTLNEDGRTHKAIAHKEMIKQLLLEKYPDFFRRTP